MRTVTKKGFTLIELLVVLVVIGILVGLILPNTLRAIQAANEKECASNIRAVDTAFQLCYTQRRNWADCDTIAELLAPVGGGTPYLDQAPVCPFAVAYTPAGGAVQGFQIDKAPHFAPWPPRGNRHVGL